MSKSRSDAVIRQANKNLFASHGLKAELAKMDALAHIARIPIMDSQGRINRESSVAMQLAELSLKSEGIMSKQKSAQELDLQQRRLRVLQPWLAELQVDVLPWTAQSKLIRFNSTLKKRHSYRLVDRYKALKGPGDEDGERFRKCLWLIIREVKC
ncbi:hypothetical protein N7532_011261 [Penicillium argentinense]|uniref:Uncharacterized protein n=1 Tax=Penicillium argentinense TaxID=1131581 RepID=A0A9W9EI36_9EURO|nr:uncharacterized protein N7532_011261 [Penicillium argentinense]KAJ5082218.1 hypothetical protein N7532_011261 [Penicillium argentinense]